MVMGDDDVKHVPDIGDCALLGFKVLFAILLSATACVMGARYLGFVPESWFHPGGDVDLVKYQSTLFAGVIILSFPVGWAVRKLRRAGMPRD